MSIKKLFTFLGWPILLIPTLVMLAGAMMNETVIWRNGGQMPVSMYACQERMAPKPVVEPLNMKQKPKAQEHKDYIHKCADANTKLRFLDDWMIGDDGVSSIGDMLQGDDVLDALKLTVYPMWIAGVGFYYLRRKYPENKF